MFLVSSLICCSFLLPTQGAAFTFGTGHGAMVLLHQSAGTPIVWGQVPIGIRFDLGAERYNDAAAMALTMWNAVVPLLMPDQASPHAVRWARPDEIFGGKAAVTTKHYRIQGGRLVITHADIALDPAACWDVYEGPLIIVQCQGRF